LNKADEVIEAQKKALDLRDTLIQEDDKEIRQLQVENDEKTEKLGSIWRNPLVSGLVGVVIGILGYSYVQRQ
jgi:hypothetical protein